MDLFFTGGQGQITNKINSFRFLHLNIVKKKKINVKELKGILLALGLLFIYRNNLMGFLHIKSYTFVSRNSKEFEGLHFSSQDMSNREGKTILSFL